MHIHKNAPVKKSLRHFEIIYTLVRAELKSEANTSLCGWLWWLLDPALSLLIYYIAFGLILNRADSGFVPFLCIGIVFWRWFQGSVMRGAGSILQAAGLFNKVQTSKFIFPLVSVLADAFRFSVSLLLLGVFLAAFGVRPGAEMVHLPFLLLTQFTLILFCSTVFSMIVPFFPDLRNMIGHGMHLLFFMSGIFFEPDQLDGSLRTLVYLNPMSGMLSSMRSVLLRNQPPDLSYVISVFLVSMAGLSVATLLLIKHDTSFAKIT